MLHSPPVLNHDVLNAVVEYAETETLLSLMLCCRALYQDGVRVLLTRTACIDRYYWFGHKKDRAVWSFLRFMSADGGRRWQSLRGLILGHERIYFHTAGRLAEGIKQAPNIEYLELRNADSLLGTYPDLRAALASLENVKHLSIRSAATHTSLLLESVRWPLVTAELDGSYCPRPNISAKMLLRCAQNTLVQLQCNSWIARDNASGNPTYPNVKSLHMFNMDSMMPDEWAKVYPNVSQLSISNRFFKKPVTDDRDNAGFRAVREMNMRALADQCWPLLERCHSDCVADLYILGLPCHIRAIKFVEAMAWCDLPLFAEIMEYARPVVLELSSKGSYLTGRLPTLQTTFQQAAHGLRDLEQLRLTLHFASDSIDTDIPHSLLQGIEVGLLPNLRILALRIDCELSYEWEHMRRIEDHKPRVEDRRPPPRSERSLITFDLRKFCRALFSLAPTLQTVALNINGMPQGMSPIDEQVQRTEVVDDLECSSLATVVPGT
ncbi:hypothetical protein C8Q74DRAFT_1370373 [Fomes fomentarius]|nr:hypothetical protein C8Q74DRAFT_1370373 [Fomes fomentarius]